MKIVVDAEGKQAVEKMCDVCLRTGGLNNLQAILQILQSIEMQPESKVTENVDESVDE